MASIQWDCDKSLLSDAVHLLLLLFFHDVSFSFMLIGLQYWQMALIFRIPILSAL